MAMASGINIWSRLMNRRMNNKTCRIDRLIRATDATPLFIDVHQVRYLDAAEVQSVRVDPERVRLHGIPQANMPTASVGESKFRKDPEGACHLLFLPLALLQW